ncbi:VTT domain-containing protein [Bombilactobacillus thymidiniphilus]|uniref:VTT domain-containing protein n=1 Tax=Bombilactobacillus thymidiniphilus TaxID=2923363 RepID=A0ABY4PEA0_9LACO|nr:VTT domain-containing protein [Bombilactobacillus thymidiniphilus]UQS83872.1 VTT domain-containing protein [Bombilactobacillus thymidiniphilus]
MQLIDFVMNVDKHLAGIVSQFGTWSYVILFAIIFIETGAVILPFLPGDSLLFAGAALAANPASGLNIWILAILFFTAAVLGDSSNYFISKHLNHWLQNKKWFHKLVKPEYLTQAEEFFERHGGKAIALGRFIPIVRTFVPFVAGGGALKYSRFLHYNIIGSSIWVAICLICGHLFGNLPFVQEHFSMIVLGIIFVSILPAIIGFFRSKKASN